MIEQTLLAAQLADSPAERTSLLKSALVSIDASAAALPAEWVSSTRADTAAKVDVEQRLDGQYMTFTKQIVDAAHRRAEHADVHGIERLADQIHTRDAALGSKRPDAVKALLEALQSELDAARKLRLARDHWATRAPDFRRYRLAIMPSIELMTQLRPALEDIKTLSGSTPGTLVTMRHVVKQIIDATSLIEPPEELKAAHAMLVSAAQLADNAARIRHEAMIADSMGRAWDASSAAAGALMLGLQARLDIRSFMIPRSFGDYATADTPGACPRSARLPPRDLDAQRFVGIGRRGSADCRRGTSARATWRRRRVRHARWPVPTPARDA